MDSIALAHRPRPVNRSVWKPMKLHIHVIVKQKAYAMLSLGIITL